jgi:YkoY family integral membrane protein
MILQYLHDIIQHPIASLLVVTNIVLLEAVLSIDNAAVLATMVMDLPKHQQSNALRYGIFGAYLFRGLAFFFATYLLKIWWLKFVGGIYLFILFINWFKQKVYRKGTTDTTIEKKSNWVHKKMNQYFGVFVSTIIMVELMDLAFSIDNIFALSAYSSNLLLLLIGSFLGILFIRFATRGFISLLELNPKMEIGAYIIIFLLSLKLIASLFVHLMPMHVFSKVVESQFVEYFISFITLAIFVISTLLHYRHLNTLKKIK